MEDEALYDGAGAAIRILAAMETFMNLTESLSIDEGGWQLTEAGWSDERAVVVGSNFMVGNGYLGYRGTSPEQGAEHYVALVVTDTYDCADGRWRELTTVPNPLFVSARVGDHSLSIDAGTKVESQLDLGAGTYGVRHTHQVDDATVTVKVSRIASYDRLHLLAQRWSLTSDRAITVEVDAGIDSDVWSLNGEHLPAIDLGVDGATITAAGTTGESGIDIGVASVSLVSGGELLLEEDVADGGRLVRRRRLAIAAGSEVIVDAVAAVASSNDGPAPLDAAKGMARAGADEGYTALAEASLHRWSGIWRDMDVQIAGNLLDQAALRFNAYHNRICTPAHSDHLPIGARGLSCQAYQGSAFWDQEIYNLPAFLFSEPDIARSLLVYRHRTLDGARRKAARLGYDGAYYAWISGTTGDELCPDIFFKDVLTGRPIRNHFNVWQMHIAPDVVTTIARYVDVTGDVEYLLDYGAEVAFEVARFLRSFVRYDDWREVYHCIRLLGPDEWHENVDDNAFTNYQTHAALDFAINTYELMASDHPAALAVVSEKLALSADEVDGWRRVRERMLLPPPDADTKLIEQFRGFFDLEDVTPDEVRTRLLDPGEYWGWPNGVAVSTQVSKQADVPMLLWLHSDRFDQETQRANYAYYEPRCSHNSSLSHAAFGMVATRTGQLEQALEHFRATAAVDLLNTSHAVVGGTFIGGIHTAACGGTYQLAVQGFGGLGYQDGQLTIDPALPAEWDSLIYPVRWQGLGFTVTVEADQIAIAADSDNDRSASLSVRGSTTLVPPGAVVTV
ncbi:MAG: glycosyl hydrolase family 65 protein [Acidimicrobiia bacterium]|nr:glycosyl hydrolase family 65 protein [Acidimicrobiia bacterium]